MLRVHVVLGGWPGAPGLYTAYFTDGQPGSAAEAADVVARVRAFWFGISAFFPSPFTINVSGDVDELDPADGSLRAQYSVTPPAQFLGTGSSTFNAFPAMFLLRLRTSSVVAGNRVQGRSFLGPTSSDTDVNGAPTASVGTAIATAAAGMLTGSTAVVPVVWTRPKPGAPGTQSAITQYSVSPKWAVLTSRRD